MTTADARAELTAVGCVLRSWRPWPHARETLYIEAPGHGTIARLWSSSAGEVEDAHVWSAVRVAVMMFRS